MQCFPLSNACLPLGTGKVFQWLEWELLIITIRINHVKAPPKTSELYRPLVAGSICAGIKLNTTQNLVHIIFIFFSSTHIK